MPHMFQMVAPFLGVVVAVAVSPAPVHDVDLGLAPSLRWNGALAKVAAMPGSTWAGTWGAIFVC